MILLVSQKDQSTPFKKIFWAENSWFFVYFIVHHDNSPAYTVLILRDFFTKHSTHIVPQPPHLPDLAPCDFWQFSKLKRPLRRHHLDSIEEIKAESKKVLNAIPEVDFNNCFEDWKKRCHKCTRLFKKF